MEQGAMIATMPPIEQLVCSNPKCGARYESSRTVTEHGEWFGPTNQPHEVVEPKPSLTDHERLDAYSRGYRQGFMDSSAIDCATACSEPQPRWTRQEILDGKADKPLKEFFEEAHWGVSPSRGVSRESREWFADLIFSCA